MNRRTVLAGLLASAATLVPGGFALGKPLDLDEPTVLRMGLRYSLQHPLTQEILLPWAAELYNRSSGQLDVQIFGAGDLASDDNLFNALLIDTISLGAISPSAVVPPLPVSSFFDCPLLFPNAEVGSLVVWEMLQENQALLDEFSLVHVLWAWISAPMLIHTVHRPVQKVEDVKGMKLITWSAIEEQIVKSLGGIAVRKGPAETRRTLKMGLVDGVICPLPPVNSFKFSEYIKYTTEVPLTSISFVMAMNNEIWSGLPRRIKTLLTMMSGEKMSARCGKFLDFDAARVQLMLKDKGHTFVSVSDANMQEWIKITEPLRHNLQQRLINSQIPHVQGLADSVHKTRLRIQSELESLLPHF